MYAVFAMITAHDRSTRDRPTTDGQPGWTQHDVVGVVPRSLRSGRRRRPRSRRRTPRWPPRRRHVRSSVGHRAACIAATTRTASALAARLVDPHPPSARRGRERRDRRRGVVALVAVGRGPSVVGQQRAEEGLPAGADQHRAAERDAARRGARAAPSCARPSWRTRGPGRGRPARRRRPQRRRPRRAGATSSAQTSATTSPYAACALHVGAVAAPVHDDVRHAAVRDQPRQVRVGQAAGHVVDDPRAGVERRLRGLASASCRC